MKKWKYLLKVVMAVGVIAMTAVQICTAAEGTAQAAVSELHPYPFQLMRFQAGLQVLRSHLRQGY